MKPNCKNTLLAACLAATASPAFAATTLVNSLADDNNASGSVSTVIDNFDGSSINTLSLMTDLGIGSALQNGSAFSPPDNYYNHPDFENREFGFALDRSNNVATRNVSWTFPETIAGFYGKFVDVTGIDVANRQRKYLA